MTTRKRQADTIPTTRFTWKPKLKGKERKRYEAILAEKIQRGEPWRDPKEIRENFVRGYAENLEDANHD
jgi:hypothetical protein